MAKRKVIVSSVIREFISANPDVGPTEAAKQLSSQLGKKVTPAYVSNIKQISAKGRGKGKAKRGRKPGRKPGKTIASGRSAADAVAVIQAASAFISSAGGIEGAMQVLEAIGGGNMTGNG